MGKQDVMLSVANSVRKIGGADFKVARKAKWEGRKAEPREFVEAVGFRH